MIYGKFSERALSMDQETRSTLKVKNARGDKAVSVPYKPKAHARWFGVMP